MDKVTRNVIDYFEQVNRIPRCSKNEAQISGWLQQWAAERGLTAKTDPAGNLLIAVPASHGFESAPVVVLQGHMDMVCEKRPDVDHDFARDPIRMVADGPWLTARDTTLGADNGIAVALAMALVDDPGLSHPPLELLFTVDEETGLNGALQMDPTLIRGRRMINLDSEDEGVFVVGCAGGRGTTIERPLTPIALDASMTLLTVSVGGLKGGHSGIDIAKHRANANKVMARLLSAGLQAGPYRLVTIRGGTARNVIPRSCTASLACRPERTVMLKQALNRAAGVIREEFRVTDPDLAITVDAIAPVTQDGQAMTESDTAAVVDLLMALPSGPVEMSADDPLQVQTSTNLATVTADRGGLSVITSQRSAMPSRLDEVCGMVAGVGRLAGARVRTDAGYPSWPMNPQSALLTRCTSLYRELFAVDPVVRVMHAGLECGVIGDRCPGMDMISLGPTIENPHSPSERLYLPSVTKVWRFLTALLASFDGPSR